MNNLLILFIIITPILIITLLIINLYLPINNPDLAKISPYE
jgi:NADH:ubiquinone oxidoreductase subunit 3 (subunit A)